MSATLKYSSQHIINNFFSSTPPPAPSSTVKTIQFVEFRKTQMRGPITFVMLLYIQADASL